MQCRNLARTQTFERRQNESELLGRMTRYVGRALLHCTNGTCSGLNSFENSLGPKLALFGFQWRCGVAAWLNNRERVGAVLQRCVTSVVEGWLARAK